MRAILASRPPNRPVAGPFDSDFSRRSSCAEAELSVPSRFMLTVAAAAAAAAAKAAPSSSSDESDESDESESCRGRGSGEG